MLNEYTVVLNEYSVNWN